MRVAGYLMVTLVASWLGPQTLPTFRAITTVVSVSVMARDRTGPVRGLRAADFSVTVDGVSQRGLQMSSEDMPTDVSLFLDTSGSTIARHDSMIRDVPRIVSALRAGDQVRVLTIGDAVYVTAPWQAPTAPLNFPLVMAPGRSLINDALVVSLAHRPAPGRRHLILALTDREDFGSVVPAEQVYEAARQSSSVLHVVESHGGGDPRAARSRRSLMERTTSSRDVLRRAAQTTGGQVHEGRFGRSTSAFDVAARVLAEFEAGYVLSFEPTGIEPAGWHRLTISLPGRSHAIVRHREGFRGR